MFLLYFLLYALVIGLSIAWVWSFAFDTHGPWDSFFWFFFIIFLFCWGGGIWITPFGPTGWGVSWLPIVCLGIFMALLLTAVTPRSSRSRTRSRDLPAVIPTAGKKSLAKMEVIATVDFFFWALIIVLGCVILSRFMWRSPYL